MQFTDTHTINSITQIYSPLHIQNTPPKSGNLEITLSGGGGMELTYAEITWADIVCEALKVGVHLSKEIGIFVLCTEYFGALLIFSNSPGLHSSLESIIIIEVVRGRRYYVYNTTWYAAPSSMKHR